MAQITDATVPMIPAAVVIFQIVFCIWIPAISVFSCVIDAVEASIPFCKRSDLLSDVATACLEIASEFVKSSFLSIKDELLACNCSFVSVKL